MRGIMLNTADGMSYTSTSGRPNALSDPLYRRDAGDFDDLVSAEYIRPSASGRPADGSSPGASSRRYRE